MTNLIKKVVIDNGVTYIGGDAFSGCKSLTSIIIPEGVSNIHTSAFYLFIRWKITAVPGYFTIRLSRAVTKNFTRTKLHSLKETRKFLSNLITYHVFLAEKFIGSP